MTILHHTTIMIVQKIYQMYTVENFAVITEKMNRFTGRIKSRINNSEVFEIKLM